MILKLLTTFAIQDAINFSTLEFHHFTSESVNDIIMYIHVVFLIRLFVRLSLDV